MLPRIISHLVLMCLIIDKDVAALSCDFDHGYCQWKQNRYDQFEWRIRNDPTPDATSGPLTDHTSGSGYYIYIQGEDARDGHSHARLDSSFVNITELTTLSFWYFMNGNGVGTLSVLIYTPTGQPTTLWTLHGRQGNEWMQAGVTLPEGLYQVEFDATAELHIGGDLALDDVKVSMEPAVVQGLTRPPPTTTPTTTTTTTTTTTPPSTPIPDITLSCDFEKDFCSWIQDNVDHFDWRRVKGLSDDRTSGPLGDHTTGKGYYAYIRGADTKHLNEYARLTTPYIVARAPTKLSFWYHMNGGGIGSLRVLRIGYGQPNEVLFNVTGRQGPEWHQGFVIIEPGVFKLVIEASAKLHYGSDIAIDDILGAIFEVFPTTTTTTTTTTAPTTEPKPITCTFETDTCGWHQFKGDNLDWSRGKGPSPDFVSGPEGDHTTGNGYYMYLDGRHVGKSDWTADLMSHDLELTSPSTLTFWYLMNGVNIGSLSLLKLASDGSVTTLWKKDGRQSPEWLEASVALPPGNYRLIFSATALRHYGSDLAIDDITLKSAGSST